MALTRFFLAILVVIISAKSSIAQDWNLVKSANGIDVYTRENPNSNFNAFRAEMTVTSNVAEMEYILKNLDKYKDVFLDTEELIILKRISQNKHIQYSHTNAPWPVSDRDGVFEVSIEINPSDGSLYSNAKALPDYLPEKDGIVRIQKSTSSWKAIPKSNGQIRIIYEVEAEPGGNIPEWLANSAASELPYNTFVNLRKVLSK
jgi:hypothetical protein